jgi:hypothetical protein
MASGVQSFSDRPASGALQVLHSPCRDRLELRFPSERTGRARTTIYNSAGRRTIQAEGLSGNSETGLDITGLSAGVHFLTIDGSPAQRAKFVKER